MHTFLSRINSLIINRKYSKYWDRYAGQTVQNLIRLLHRISLIRVCTVCNSASNYSHKHPYFFSNLFKFKIFKVISKGVPIFGIFMVSTVLNKQNILNAGSLLWKRQLLDYTAFERCQC